ncbi:MAG: bifunctional phosphoribosylaminoimidazolecarboxamide formyltransferase/IMP cyclohydrolase [Christensenellaceae bacterium]|jgi:phosphoribosylaminoimidazolecarboxamide formyltransferase/IMP cyclohydrolase
MGKKAFISVFDKTGAVQFAKELTELGYDILSTGGTQKELENANIPVTNVSDITGFPECLDGRVKTLHPKIHAGILAMRGNPEHMKQLNELGVDTIDIVAVNLYPFKQTISKEDVTLEDAIENIDIGGPTMLRAAAKNWQDVAVLVDPEDYPKLIQDIKNNNGEICKQTKFYLAAKVFENTAAYDALIAQYMRKQAEAQELVEGLPDKLTLTYEKQQDMRYGENPYQRAAFYREPLHVAGSLVNAEQLNGKELSYNNINDAGGALETLREFDETTVVAVKHANPCGVGSADTLYDAYVKAHDCDPVSIYGGIVATNAEVDEKTAAEMSKIFLEIIIAPSYTNEALEILKQKKNLRVLRLPDIAAKAGSDARDMKKVLGGLLYQDMDTKLLDGELKVVTKRQPTEKELQDMLFGFKVVKHVKSNAIVIAKDGATTGVGPGQTNRIWSAEMAIERSGEKVKGAVLASDAFFPFDDTVEAAAKAGITAIIQPGGSVRDEDSIKKCDEYGIAMVFTGIRHFKH